MAAYRELRGHPRQAVHEINSAIRGVMGELGLGLSHEAREPLTTDIVEDADVVITMGGGDACPVFPGKRDLDRELIDPAGEGVDDVRPIRDHIDQRVRALLSPSSGPLLQGDPAAGSGGVNGEQETRTDWRGPA